MEPIDLKELSKTGKEIKNYNQYCSNKHCNGIIVYDNENIESFNEKKKEIIVKGTIIIYDKETGKVKVKCKRCKQINILKDINFQLC